MAGACLSDAEVAALIGDASPALRARADEHAADCNACRELLACLGRVLAAERRDDPERTLADADDENSIDDGRSDDAAAPSVGSVVGRYRLQREVGRGGMGVVHEAHDPQLDRRVAVKLLHGRRDLVALARVVREAQAVAALSHPNVVQVLDVSLTGAQTYIVMEFVDGATLRDWVHDEHPAWRSILRAYLQAGRGLQAAHAAGIVHRDFKPSNAIIDPRGNVKVLDFGLARPDASGSGSISGEGALPLSATTLTATGTAMGTPLYMAPEQHRGQRVDARADVYAFGISLYEGLYGRLPFAARTLDHLLVHKRRGPPTEPPDPRIPTRIHDAIRKALAWDPDARWTSMAELLAELERPPTRRVGLWIASAAVVGLAIVGLLDRPQRAIEHEPVAPPAIDAALTSEVERLLALADTQGDDDDAARGLGTAAAALPLAAGSGSPSLLARAELQLGGSLLDAGRLELAVAWLREGVVHAREVGDDRSAAIGAIRSIFALGELERPQEALAAAREARALAKRVGDDDTLRVRILENEATVLPDGPERIQRMEEALAMRRANPELGAPHALAMALSNLAGYLPDAERSRARELLLEALTLRREALGPDHRDTLGTMLQLAALHAASRDWAACASQARPVYERLDPSHAKHRVSAAGLAAACLRQEGRLDEGMALTVSALAEYPEGRINASLRADLVEVEAGFLLRRGEFAEAEKRLLAVLTIREEYADGPSHDVALSYHNLALLARESGDLDRAERYATRAIEEFVAVGSDAEVLLRSRTELGRVLLATGRAAAAVDSLEGELTVSAERRVSPGTAAEAKGVYARALWEVGDERNRATTLCREALDALPHDEEYAADRETLQQWLASRG